MNIVKILQKKPLASSDICAILVKNGISKQTARQRVHRLSKTAGIMTLSSFLPKREKILFTLGEDGGVPLKKLIELFQSKESTYGRIIGSINENGGIVSKKHFPIITGAPNTVASKKIPTEKLIENLRQYGFIDVTETQETGTLIRTQGNNSNFSANQSFYMARITTENILLRAVHEWMRKISLCSYDSIIIRDAENVPTIGPYAWHITAPTYLHPLKMSPKRNGFIACDISLNTVGIWSAKSFLEKCISTRIYNNIAPCLQIYIAPLFSEEAFGLLKRSGVMPIQTDQIFGKGIAKSLNEICTKLTSAFSNISLQKIEKIITKIEKITPDFNNLRGAMFEFLVERMLRKETSSAHMYMGKRFKLKDGREFEIDIIADEIDSIVFVEAKGYKYGAVIPDIEVSEWIERIKKTREYHKENKRIWSNNQTFQFWTTGKLSTDSKKLIEKHKSKKYKIEVYEVKDVEKVLANSKNTFERKTIKEHFKRT